VGEIKRILKVVCCAFVLAGRYPKTEKKKQAGRQAHQVQAGSDDCFNFLLLFLFSLNALAGKVGAN
jgi:hypothetical protein